MTLLQRLLVTLPPFLRPRISTGSTVDLEGGIAAGNEDLRDEFRILRARGAARRFSGEFPTYYASNDRQDDVARIGAARLLSKRENETWSEFETRVQDAIGLEAWDGAKQRYTAVGDLSLWGCFSGIKKELERTGLLVDEIYRGYAADDWWVVYDFDHLPADPLDRCKVYSIGEIPPEGQRLCKVYSIGYLAWTFYVVLAHPVEGPVDYLEDEIKSIIRLTKSAWTRCLLKFPGAVAWTEIL